MSSKYAYFENALNKKLEQNQYRQLRCIIPMDEANILQNGEKIINFASNDYLGLSNHPYIKKNTIKYVLQWGAGSTASRWIPGHLQCHQNLEKRLAEMLGSEKSMLFYSSFQAHFTLLSALTNARSLVFIDKSCHSRLTQNAKVCKGRVIAFEHNNMQHLQKLLEKHQKTPACCKLIISESVFHLDGDRAKLEELAEISKQHNALLYIDDSYAFGVLGSFGKGLAAQRKGIDITVGTFGKACGSFGAFAACNELLKEYLLHFSPAFANINALPPAILGAVDAALDLIPDMETERNHILKTSHMLKKKLEEEGFQLKDSNSHIISVKMNNNAEMMKSSEFLRQENFLVGAIRSPAAPDGIPRLKLAVNAELSPKNILDLCAKLKQWKKERGLADLIVPSMCH
ncbi:MAG: 8-amino-7-oxononanoate synthase [Simkaniaceae bacterium]